MSRGVLYVASGDKYINAAKKSAISLKKHNPSIPITIYSDSQIDSDVFDSVIQIDKSLNEIGDSILSEEHFPYDRNLYLDVDTYICGELDELFNLLDSFELAASYGFKLETVETVNDIPQSFPEINTGVVVYQDTASVQQLFNDWKAQYEQDTKSGIYANQPSFRRIIYHSDINFAVLPKIYNCRTPFSGFLNNKAIIIHGWHNQPIDAIASKINRTNNPRLHVGMRDDVAVFSPAEASIKDWVLFTMATNGILQGLIQSLRLGLSKLGTD